MTDTGSPDAGFVLPRPTQMFPLTRHLSWHLTRILVRTPLTPNQITALSMLAGLAGAWCFTYGTRSAGVAGGLLLILCYTLDNCDGEIARLKKLSSEWGAHFDDVVDWLVDGAFFAGLGYGVWQASGEMFWLWLGLAATAGATIDYVVDIVLDWLARAKPAEKTREEQATDVRKPEDALDWAIYIFHKLSRADFCVIVFVLALGDFAWVLLPLGAVGAQVYWITDLFKRARGWHT